MKVSWFVLVVKSTFCTMFNSVQFWWAFPTIATDSSSWLTHLEPDVVFCCCNQSLFNEFGEVFLFTAAVKCFVQFKSVWPFSSDLSKHQDVSTHKLLLKVFNFGSKSKETSSFWNAHTRIFACVKVTEITFCSILKFDGNLLTCICMILCIALLALIGW